MPPARILLWLFLAGGFGATLRVVLAAAIDAWAGDRVPHVGVLAVNVIGCFLIGAGSVALPIGGLRPVLLGGLLGGFTTYSAFALLTYQLGAEGRAWVAALQVGAHVLVGLVAVWLGIVVGRLMTNGAQP